MLTTASCLMQFESTPNPMNTVIYERPAGAALRALRIFIHPDCSSETRIYSSKFDFAIISIERSEQTTFPALPHEGQHLERETPGCLMSSYGDKVRFNLSNFKVIPLDETQWNFIKCRVNDEYTCVLCLHFPFIMPCREDVGTPIICNGTLIALYSPRVYSLSVKCKESYVAHFSYISSTLRWIEAIVNAPENNFVWMSNSGYFLLLCFVVLAAVAGIYLGVVEVMQRSLDTRDSIVEETRPSFSNTSLASTKAKACVVPWFADQSDSSIAAKSSKLEV